MPFMVKVVVFFHIKYIYILLLFLKGTGIFSFFLLLQGASF